ncbi:MAG: hypothetical protein MR455_02925 [Prevotella sp.]|nr:hypothetical protein [Prevotella sp.]
MKRKLWMAMFVMVMGFMMVACNQSNPAEKAKSLIEEMKSEGSNWDVATWKEKGMAFIDAVKPMLASLKDVKNDPSKLTDLMNSVKEVQPLLKDFQEAAMKTEAGKKLFQDTDFLQKFTSLTAPEEQ